MKNSDNVRNMLMQNLHYTELGYAVKRNTTGFERLVLLCGGGIGSQGHNTRPDCRPGIQIADGVEVL
jgi:hypothetical protein